MRRFLSSVAVIAWHAASADAVAQLPDPVIDMHMHARTTASRNADGSPANLPCVPQGCVPIPTVVRTDSDVMRLALEAMDRNNVVLAVVSDPGLPSIYEWAAARPGRFLPGVAVFNPLRADTAMLRSEFEAGRLRIMGEIATQYRGYPPDDPANEPLFALAEALDVPVLIHTEGIAGGAPTSPFRIAHGHPERLQEVLIRHPNMRIWLENAAYPFLDEVISLMYRYPHVYADISTITWIIPRKEFWRYLEALVNAGLGGRLMWGSDQMNWPEAIDVGLSAIREAPFLSEAQRRDILYNNAARFLRLPQHH